MKLYYVASARMPHKKAYAIQIAKMGEAFAEEGIDFELILPKQTGAPESIRDYYGLRPELQVTRLPSLGFYARGRWRHFFSSLSFVVSYTVYLLFKKLRGERGVVYTIDMDTFSFVPAAFLGLPCFLETHGGKTKSWLNRTFFKRAAGVVVINKIIKEQIADALSYPREKMLVCPNGIDLDLFNPVSKTEARTSLSLPTDAKIVMYCGRFYGWKGLEVLVDAAKNLAPGVFIYIVGGTKEEFMTIAKKTALPDNLVFPGEKPYTAIPLWLSAADALLVLGTRHDTQSYRYTSPMKVFEYLAMKRPIVASETPAIRDIVSDEHVIFYEPDDPKDLARKIDLSVSGADSVVEKTVAAAARAEDFTWEKRAKDILTFIQATA